jgi:hypothetical protein
MFSSYLEFQTMDKTTNPMVLSVLHNHQNTLVSTRPMVLAAHAGEIKYQNLVRKPRQ